MSLRTHPRRFDDRDFNRKVFEDANNSLDDKVRRRVEHFHSIGVAPLIDLGSLALLLGVSTQLVFSIINRPRRHYRRFKLKKRSGKRREISAPRTYLKVVQWWILENILEASTFPEFVTGFVKGKSCIDNAKFHLGAKHILNLDIEDFFPSVSISKVRLMFRAFGYSEEICEQLSSLTTLNETLPQGAPTSPTLANLAMQNADKAIAKLCDRKGFRYSRYADDLTFSSEKKIPLDFVKEIGAILKLSGFKLNDSKTRFMGRGSRMEITGLVINHGINQSRTWRRMVRATVHSLSQNKKVSPKNREKLIGYRGTLLGLQQVAVADSNRDLLKRINQIINQDKKKQSRRTR